MDCQMLITWPKKLEKTLVDSKITAETTEKKLLSKLKDEKDLLKKDIDKIYEDFIVVKNFHNYSEYKV